MVTFPLASRSPPAQGARRNPPPLSGMIVGGAISLAIWMVIAATVVVVT